jgi:hypothetical protein
MNTKRAMKWSLLVASAGCMAVASMPGCELLVTFDRSLIPAEGGTGDATESDGEFNPDSVNPNETGLGMDAPAAPDGTQADAPQTDAPATAADAGDAGAGKADAGAEAAAVDAGAPDAGGEASAVDAPSESGSGGEG